MSKCTQASCYSLGQEQTLCFMQQAVHCIPSKMLDTAYANAMLVHQNVLTMRFDLCGTGRLPASWGQPGAFPLLQLLSLEANQLSGDLPTAWGSKDAFQVLSSLGLASNSLSGELLLCLATNSGHFLLNLTLFCILIIAMMHSYDMLGCALY